MVRQNHKRNRQNLLRTVRIQQATRQSVSQRAKRPHTEQQSAGVPRKSKRRLHQGATPGH